MIGEIINSFTKTYYFMNKFNLGSPFQHDATICDKSVCNVKLPQNYGLSDEVCLNLLYRPIHILFEPNVEYLVKKPPFCKGFFDFLDCQTSSNGLAMPKFELPTKFCIDTMPLRSLQPLKKCLWGMVKKYLQN